MKNIAAKIRNNCYKAPVRDLQTKTGYRTQRKILRATHHTEMKAVAAKMPGAQLTGHCIQPFRGT